MPLIVLSSTEAEYVAVCYSTQEALWIKNILNAFNRNVEKISIRYDSHPAIAMFKSVGIHGRSKHVDINM